MRISPRHTSESAKRATNLSLSEDLLRQAKELQINVSRAVERGLAGGIAEKHAENWLRENAEALESSNRYVEEHGLPLARHRQF